MKTSMTARSAVVLAVVLAGTAAQAEVIKKRDTINGTVVEYLVVLPNGYDPAKAYPAVLAFPPGDQTMSLVEGMIRIVWREHAEERGYLVIEPAAPEGQRFTQGGDRIFPAFFDKIQSDYKILDNKFHIAGISAGGASAFWIAAQYPDKFWSVTGFPGYLRDGTPKQLNAFARMCVHMFVGEFDSDATRNSIEQQAETFRAKGFDVSLSVEKDEQHVILGLTRAGAARLFDQFDAARKGTCAVHE